MSGHTCGNCGAYVECDAALYRRAPRGSGTQSAADKPMSENDGIVFRIMTHDWETVRQVQSRLASQGNGMNYHTVQAALSRLLGRGQLEADATKIKLLYRVPG